MGLLNFQKFNSKDLKGEFSCREKLREKSDYQGPRRQFSEEESGMAILETVPLLVVFLVLMTYAIGYWGAVHAGILNSMAARTYAFETMRNRSNLIMFRESANKTTYYKVNFRFHAINGQGDDAREDDFYASKYPISFKDFQVEEKLKTQKKPELHRTISSPEARYITEGRVKEEETRIGKIWVKVGYGYCLNIKCEE